MSEGMRDGFVENDVIGNYAIGTNFLGSSTSRKRSKKTKSRRKRAKNTHRSRRRSRSRKSSRKSSSRGVKYTKNGQPYKILANGRARFIKGKRRK